MALYFLVAISFHFSKYFIFMIFYKSNHLWRSWMHTHKLALLHPRSMRCCLHWAIVTLSTTSFQFRHCVHGKHWVFHFGKVNVNLCFAPCICYYHSQGSLLWGHLTNEPIFPQVLLLGSKTPASHTSHWLQFSRCVQTLRLNNRQKRPEGKHFSAICLGSVIISNFWIGLLKQKKKYG